MNDAPELRALRDRLAALDAGTARLGSFPARGPGVYVGRVFNNGSMPTTVPGYFATRPVYVGGAECEACPGSLTTDPTGLVYVLVLGKVPSVGDNLIASAIDGRWVAESGANDLSPCARFGLPKQELHATITDEIRSQALTFTFQDAPFTDRIRSGSPFWVGGCFLPFNGFQYAKAVLYCSGGWIVNVYYYNDLPGLVGCDSRPQATSFGPNDFHLAGVMFFDQLQAGYSADPVDFTLKINPAYDNPASPGRRYIHITA